MDGQHLLEANKACACDMSDQTQATQPSSTKGSAFNGRRIKPLRKGSVMGHRRGNEIIGQVNALSTWIVRTVDGPTASIQIGDNGTSLSIPKGGGRSTSVSGSSRYLVQAVYGDYLECVSWDGFTTGDTVYVAKPPELRHSITSQVIEGDTVDYTYAARTGNLDGSRTAILNPDTDPSSAQLEIVIPVYMDDDSTLAEIWADEPAGGTGVTVGGNPLTLMDTNRAARAWCQIG